LLLLILFLAAPAISVAVADDSKVDAAALTPAAKAAVETNKAAADPNPGPGQPPDQEDPKAKLLAVFKAEKPITNSLGMVMVWVPQNYRVSRYEVTQREFEQVMKTNPGKFKGDSHPVENVTWEEAAEFCKKLTQKEQAEGKLPDTFYYALPSEEQWEFYVDEATVKDAITSYLNDRKSPENVGLLGANKFGLYDVRGNVWEWCSSPVARGGSWRTFEDWLAISFRYVGAPGTRYDDVGFRCILMEQ
jgi:formylglycine-generating enzyme required for sulfatase activity